MDHNLIAYVVCLVLLFRKTKQDTPSVVFPKLIHDYRGSISSDDAPTSWIYWDFVLARSESIMIKLDIDPVKDIKGLTISGTKLKRIEQANCYLFFTNQQEAECKDFAQRSGCFFKSYDRVKLEYLQKIRKKESFTVNYTSIRCEEEVVVTTNQQSGLLLPPDGTKPQATTKVPVDPTAVEPGTTTQDNTSTAPTEGRSYPSTQTWTIPVVVAVAVIIVLIILLIVVYRIRITRKKKGEMKEETETQKGEEEFEREPTYEEIRPVLPARNNAPDGQTVNNLLYASNQGSTVLTVRNELNDPKSTNEQLNDGKALNKPACENETQEDKVVDNVLYNA